MTAPTDTPRHGFDLADIKHEIAVRRPRDPARADRWRLKQERIAAREARRRHDARIQALQYAARVACAVLAGVTFVALVIAAAPR